tara:strand:+ start:305 stop:853 length:549 start_codon:yes stop_codon:yes gene_type:complete
MSYHDGPRPYRGGIQPGTTASSAASDKIDKQVRRISKKVYAKLKSKYPELERHHKLPKKYLFEGIGACAPDGGVWFYGGKLIAALEAKHQGAKGNAIERWFKNYHHIVETNPRCPLVTFATGEGTMPGKPIFNALYRPVRGKYGILRSSGPSVFMNRVGFSDDFIEETITKFVENEIRSVYP